MSSFVLDTSVIVKWFNQEDELRVDLARAIYLDMIDGKISIIVPNLLAVELVNVLLKGKHLPPEEISKSIENLFALPLILKEPSQEVLKQCASLAYDYNLTSYDALFIATALNEGCRLITDDNTLFEKITDSSIILLKDYQRLK